MFISLRLGAQSCGGVNVIMPELLQYQCTKIKNRKINSPFKKYGFKHIRVKHVVDDDTLKLWGFNISANLEYDREKHPLYRLFRKKDMFSMAVIDYLGDGNTKCQLVFWNKKYYRCFSAELLRMGFVLHNSTRQTNALEFRKENVTIGVDVIVWGDIYLLEVVNLGNN